MTQERFTDRHVPDMTGKVAFITGANTGLGFEAAKVLVAQGADVIIGCRSAEKAGVAMEAILADSPTGTVSSISLDLGNIQSIHAAVRELESHSQLDLLINNAGIMTPPYALTADGFESQFGVNHLGPFALTGLLIDKLISTPEARIVNTSSLAGRHGKLLFGDINARKGYDAMERYSMSKLANLVFSNELDRRLKSSGARALSVACHPGIANTELSRYFPKWFKLLTPLVSTLFNTPAEGAWPTLQAATDETVRGGEYFGPSRWRQTSGPSRKVKNSAEDFDQTLVQELWEVSSEMTGVHYL